MGRDYPEYLLPRDPAPPYEGEGPFALWHFSEDPSLGRFRPQVLATARVLPARRRGHRFGRCWIAVHQHHVLHATTIALGLVTRPAIWAWGGPSGAGGRVGLLRQRPRRRGTARHGSWVGV
jgi:hypothetical protein